MPFPAARTPSSTNGMAEKKFRGSDGTKIVGGAAESRGGGWWRKLNDGVVLRRCCAFKSLPDWGRVEGRGGWGLRNLCVKGIMKKSCSLSVNVVWLFFYFVKCRGNRFCFGINAF
ncbi:hypothetical protein CEXT_747331 [Caerostris extrusa]|uniref:Uncharacterized protein n=1 Tax=Caerostris extrusa TaxID=172846 RepID=A0AAV4S2W0_CAEEX|nr:hypothetical protein CEXT_747331 [Caerostris extrusa]